MTNKEKLPITQPHNYTTIPPHYYTTTSSHHHTTTSQHHHTTTTTYHHTTTPLHHHTTTPPHHHIENIPLSSPFAIPSSTAPRQPHPVHRTCTPPELNHELGECGCDSSVCAFAGFDVDHDDFPYPGHGVSIAEQLPVPIAGMEELVHASVLVRHLQRELF